MAGTIQITQKRINVRQNSIDFNVFNASPPVIIDVAGLSRTHHTYCLRRNSRSTTHAMSNIPDSSGVSRHHKDRNP
jgi:hypothetical protein